MDLNQQIDHDLIQALKSKDELAVLTLRQLKTALNNTEIANKRQKLDAAGIIKVFKSEVKKRRESATLYRQGGRAELADKEEKEVAIIGRYLPAELSEAETKVKVKAIVDGLGAVGPGDLGKVMGTVMVQLKDQADGAMISRAVKELLQT